MSSEPLSFCGEASKRVDRIYQTPEIITQRRFTLEHIALQLGEHVLDIGSGPGLLARQMADLVGDNGRVVALDPSADMRAIARQRCQDRPCIDVIDGHANALPLEDKSFDAAVATQVYEFVPEIAEALTEAHRVLKPGGRLAIIDTDWDSTVMRTADRTRTHTIMEARRNHFVHADLPARLPSLVSKAGFTVAHVGGIPVINTAMTPGSYGEEVLRSTARLAVKEGLVSTEAAETWVQELEDFDRRGEFFFSITRFFFLAKKPD